MRLAADDLDLALALDRHRSERIAARAIRDQGDGVVTAIKRAKGSTNGARLAAQMEKFRKVPTLSGLVSFSPQLHTVFGRQYRVIQIQDNKGKRIGAVTAKVVPKI